MGSVCCARMRDPDTAPEMTVSDSADGQSRKSAQVLAAEDELSGELLAALLPLPSDSGPLQAGSFAHHKPFQRWTTPRHVARYLGFTTRTVAKWVQLGILPGRVLYTRHYTDDRGRRTRRGRTMIYEDDLRAWLGKVRASGKVSGFGKIWKGPSGPK